MRMIASGQRFGRHLHVKSIGVQQSRCIQHHTHMAFPEHQIAAAQIALTPTASPKGAFSLCMSVSRGQAMPRGGERGLDQAGAIQAGECLATPDIGHTQKRSATATKSVLRSSSGAR